MLARSEQSALRSRNITLLSFLYSTSTIQHWPQYPQECGCWRRNLSRYENQTPHRSRTCNTQSAQSTPNDRSRQPRPRRQPDIPFERPLLQKDPYSELELEGSTITPNERKAFEGLFSLRRERAASEDSVTDRRHAKPTTDRQKTGADAIGNSSKRRNDGETHFVDHAEETWSPDLSPALLELAKQARSKKIGLPQNEDGLASSRADTSTARSQKQRVSEAAQKELRTITQAMAAAQTDAQIWRMLESQVFKPAATQLQGLQARYTSTSDYNSYSGLDSTGPILSRLQTANDKELLHLQSTLPTHLTIVFKHLLTHYPSSLLPLSILPTLERLGHIAVAIGTSTQLYNLHLEQLWKRYGSTRLNDIVEVLKTARNESKVDSETLGLLNDVLAYKSAAVRGQHGESLRVLWEMEMVRSAMDEVARLRGEVVEKVEEAALRDAWERESGRV